nr:MAG TPA: hypothetical protein [Caudoviricetes sp.]
MLCLPWLQKSMGRTVWWGLGSSSRRASPRRMARTGARGCVKARDRLCRGAASSSAHATCTRAQ